MEKWQDPKVLALWIAIIMVIVFTILLFVVKIMHTGYKKMTEANLRQARLEIDHQKKLMEVGLLAQEKERTRIAADLHDGLIGKLSVIRMKAQLAKTPQDIEIMLGESIAEARRISHDLMPPLIEFLSVSELIAQLIMPWEDKYSVFLTTDVRKDDALAPELKIQLVRVLQEIVTNTVKHAKASEIKVYWRYTGTSFSLLVADNGIGFKQEALKSGLGLGSLEMRSQYLGAKVKVKSQPGKGTRIILHGVKGS